MSFPLQQIVTACNGQLNGDPKLKINGVAPLEEASVGQLTFLLEEKFLKPGAKTQASVLVVKKGVSTQDLTT